jgi:hypothetical protein
MFCDGSFGDLGYLVMGPLKKGRYVMGHFVMGRSVMGRFVCVVILGCHLVLSSRVVI